MKIFNNGGDHRSYKGDSSLPAASGHIVPPTDPTLGDANILGPDPAPRVDAPIPTLTLDQAVGPVILNPLSCEQLRQFVMETINSILRGSQASGAGPSSQQEKGGIPGVWTWTSRFLLDFSKIDPPLLILQAK
ncbi:UNVERIFIED_CONTAM: hypothetical protein Sindi_1249200, partial [Sesamum indicum]